MMTIHRERGSRISISASFQAVTSTKGRRKGGQNLTWDARGGTQDGFDMLLPALLSLPCVLTTTG